MRVIHDAACNLAHKRKGNESKKERTVNERLGADPENDG